MATIDVTTIQGYDSMTAEQKVEALLNVNILEQIDMSKFVPKETADKYASEAADYKKQLRNKMTDDEVAKAEYDREKNELQEKYNVLLKKSTIADHTAKYLAMPGYDEKLARETAEALFDGNMEKVFANQQKANESYEKKIKAEAMKGMREPAKGDDDDKPENVEYAKQRGKARADALKASKDVLSHYM